MSGSSPAPTGLATHRHHSHVARVVRRCERQCRDEPDPQHHHDDEPVEASHASVREREGEGDEERGQQGHRSSDEHPGARALLQPDGQLGSAGGDRGGGQERCAQTASAHEGHGDGSRTEGEPGQRHPGQVEEADVRRRRRVQRHGDDAEHQGSDTQHDRRAGPHQGVAVGHGLIIAPSAAARDREIFHDRRAESRFLPGSRPSTFGP